MTTPYPEILERKKNLNYLKPETKRVSREIKKMWKCLHQRIIELEFEMEKELNEKNFAVEYYSNKTDEASQDYLEAYQTKLKDFITNKNLMKLYNKKFEAEVDNRRKSDIKKKIEKHKTYDLINKCAIKINFESEEIITPLKQKVSEIISNFIENINKAENYWLDIMQSQEKKFLLNLIDKKANKKINSMTPTRENLQDDPKIFSTAVAKIEAAYIKRPKTSLFDVTDDYAKKILYYIKMSFNMPMNSVITTFENNFKKRIKMNEEYSEQIKELELLGRVAEYMVDDLISEQRRKSSDEDAKFKIQLQRLKSKKFKKTLRKEIIDLNEVFSQQVFEILSQSNVI